MALAVAWPRAASANLIQDADFTQLTYTGSLPLTTVFGMFGTETGSTLTLAGWTTGGYNFVYAAGTMDSGNKTNGANAGAPNEAPGEYNTSAGYGNTYMLGSNNGGVSVITAAPAGGNFIAMDGAFQTSAVKQTITGLTVGQVYALKFYWAAAQQQGFSGATTESVTVTLGTQAFTTSTYNLASQSFSGHEHLGDALIPGEWHAEWRAALCAYQWRGPGVDPGFFKLAGVCRFRRGMHPAGDGAPPAGVLRCVAPGRKAGLDDPPSRQAVARLPL
jgi:hypothetical protein